MTKQKLTLSSLSQYGILAIPLAFAGFPLYVLAPDFYAINYDIKLSSLGIALLVLRLFDAFQDPLIGILSDRYRSKTLFTMGLAAFVLVASIYVLFNHTFGHPLTCFFLGIGIAVTAYSVLTINLNALGALWIKEKQSQTIIAATREGFGLLGLVIAVSLPNILEKLVTNDKIYTWFSLILLVLTVIAFLNFYIWYPFKNQIIKKTTDPFIFNGLKSFSPDSKKFFVIYATSMFASSIPAVLVIFFVRDLLGAENYTGLFLLVYFLSGFAFMPLWNAISKKYGKYKSWFFSMVLASTSFVGAFLLAKGNYWQYALICLASGSALGADLIFPPAIIADQIHLEKAENSTSTHYGFLTLIAKASLALASGISFFFLEFFGFVPGLQNSLTGLIGLRIAYALIPFIIKLIAAFFLWHIFIKPQKQFS